MAVTRSTASVNSGTETVVVTLTTSGTTKLKGFNGTGPVEAIYTLYIGGAAQADYITTSGDLNAYMLFPDVAGLNDIATSTVIELKATHYANGAKTFRGTLYTG